MTGTVLRRSCHFRLTYIDRPSSSGIIAQEQPAGYRNKPLGQLFQDLSVILEETDTEFSQLPIFVRPMAKQGFKSKSGASLADWRQLITQLAAGKQKMPADMVKRLSKLARYFRELPKETARFTKDEETLREITLTARERLEVIGSLQDKIQSSLS